MKTQLFSLALLVSSFTFAQSWNLNGNTGTNPSNNFIGTTDNQPLVLKSNNNAGLRLLPAGDVRVGLNDVDTASPAELRVYNSESTLVEVANSLGRFQIAKAGCDGCYSEKAGDTVLRNLGKTHNIILSLPNDNNDGTSYIGINDGARGTWIKFFNNGIARFDGKINAKEVEVKANVWADYVFKKEYQLRSLEDVEKHIIEKGHLPNIPTAQEVLENGINLAEMNSKLLEKIEELTLYSIEQNKKLKSQAEEIKILKKQSKELQELKYQVQQLFSTKK
ncbi:cell wall anchor protein [Chryseobacterium bernardetii]|uniref:cell wall anchor protein n=1 Tax=Chryseobacterium bernardetii TaxID=1241978 RepID=UPI003AF90364